MNQGNTAKSILIQPVSGKMEDVQPQRMLNWKYKNQRKKSIRSRRLKEQIKNNKSCAQFFRVENINFLQVIFSRIKKPAMKIAGFFS